MFCALLLASSAFNGPAVSRVARSQSAVAMKEPGAIVVKNSWVKVCDASSLKPNTLNPTFAAGQDILIAVEKSGTVYATANVCPHIGTPLDQGKIKDGATLPPRERARARASTPSRAQTQARRLAGAHARTRWLPPHPSNSLGADGEMRARRQPVAQAASCARFTAPHSTLARAS